MFRLSFLSHLQDVTLGKPKAEKHDRDASLENYKTPCSLVGSTVQQLACSNLSL